VSRVGVTDAAVETAEHLLTMAIRAIDYCPPTDLLFVDFLCAMLTADYEMHPDDSRHGYRQALRESFAAFGFVPETGDASVAEPCLWGPPDGDGGLRYGRTHFESMQHDPDEIFRFLWENRIALGVDEDAYTSVQTVAPCYRVSSDGFLLHETVATYTQQVRMKASELKSYGLKRPEEMPLDLELTIYGGGSLIFDESGRLKYHVRNRLRSAERQNPRLKYLWETGGFNTRKAFGALHLERILGGHTRAEPQSHAEESHAEEDDNGHGAE
jgi:hypothetical protein